LGKEYGPSGSEDYPLLPGPVRGLEKTIVLLERLIDPSSKVLVVSAAYPMNTSGGRAGRKRGSKKGGKGGGTTATTANSNKSAKGFRARSKPRKVENPYHDDNADDDDDDNNDEDDEEDDDENMELIASRFVRSGSSGLRMVPARFRKKRKAKSSGNDGDNLHPSIPHPSTTNTRNRSEVLPPPPPRPPNPLLADNGNGDTNNEDDGGTSRTLPRRKKRKLGMSIGNSGTESDRRAGIGYTTGTNVDHNNNDNDGYGDNTESAEELSSLAAREILLRAVAMGEEQHQHSGSPPPSAFPTNRGSELQDMMEGHLGGGELMTTLSNMRRNSSSSSSSSGSSTRRRKQRLIDAITNDNDDRSNGTLADLVMQDVEAEEEEEENEHDGVKEDDVDEEEDMEEDGECVTNNEVEEDENGEDNDEEDDDEELDDDDDEEEEDDGDDMDGVDGEDDDEDEDEEIESDDDETDSKAYVAMEDDVLVGDVIVDEGAQFEDPIMVVDEMVEDEVGRLHHQQEDRQQSSSADYESAQATECHKQHLGKGASLSGVTTSISAPSKNCRKQAFLRAGMEVLEAQHPYVQGSNLFQSRASSNESVASGMRTELSFVHCADIMPPLLTPSAEQSLILSLCNIIKPPKKTPNLKVFMRRAPTQEEFFRGSLSRNPIPISSLKTNPTSGTSSATTTAISNKATSSDDTDNEARVIDLRQHIANDLQMSDSAELLELLVANKILDVNLKLRVVSQVLWKKHIMENATSNHTGSSSSAMLASVMSGRQIISSGSGLSMVFGIGDRPESGSISTRGRVDENTPISMLPPMIVTYRLAGVDGEATEDIVEVSDLVDPDAPPDTGTSDEEYEMKMEKEFGITRLVTKHRGVTVLLRSIESYLGTLIKRIRRDDVGKRIGQQGREVTTKNPSKATFLKSPPCPALMLLRYCARLADNRKKMLKSRAPTILLRLLLDVLNSIDKGSSKKIGTLQQSKGLPSLSSNESSDTSPNSDNSNKEEATAIPTTEISQQMPNSSNKLLPIGNNPTADALQELIETLSSEISVENEKKGVITTTVEEDLISDNENMGESTLPILLSSLRSTSLSLPLRKVIAKLLPFLTYGQIAQSRALASHFIRHINIDELGANCSKKTLDDDDNGVVLMQTFVEAAIHLPPVAICDTLRAELIRQGFVTNIKTFILREVPFTPPPWSPALFSKVSGLQGDNKTDRESNEKRWREYYGRKGLQISLRILIGLCANHFNTQTLIADSDLPENGEKNSVSLIIACHWIESTSDNNSADIDTNGLGILAETLLDALQQNNEPVKDKISFLRKKTRDRKKQIAQERRNKTLVGMGAFGHVTGVGASISNGNPTPNFSNAPGQNSSRTNMFSTITNVFSSRRRRGESSATNSNATPKKSEANKPAWMLELEAMEDEKGLTCAVCQEGRTLQPTELLGLYAYMKKIAIPSNRGGDRISIDGTVLLHYLPQSLPDSLSGSPIEKDWFLPAKSAVEAMKKLSRGTTGISLVTSSVSSSRPCNFISSVTAGNAIHCSCHARARTVDRNHSKAPKSEWEGASLRNSRVSCNVILPLISTHTVEVPVMSVETALADHQSAVTNLLGVRPKSMLWNTLHDVRLLILRMSYGEALNIDCGGGSLSSNTALIFHMLFMADMFVRDAKHDTPETVQHARELSSALLATSKILEADDYESERSNTLRLCQGFADASPMAALCCILFCNTAIDDDSHSNKRRNNNVTGNSPLQKRRWNLHKNVFLCGLIRCAGRRYALGIHSSGCESTRRNVTDRRLRSTSFSEWALPDKNNIPSGTSRRSLLLNSGAKTVDDYAKVLRPMITMFAILDCLSELFSLNMDDESIEKSVERLVEVVQSCQSAPNIRSLMNQAKINLDDDKILYEIEAGIKTV